MNEKLSPVDSVVGSGLTDSDKKQNLDIIGERYTAHDGRDLEPDEVKKDKYLKEGIVQASKFINSLRHTMGLGDFVVNPDAVYIIRDDAWGDDESVGRSNILRGRIRVLYRKNHTQLLKSIIHEILHLSSYNAVKIDDGDENVYQSGIEVQSSTDDSTYFTHINEAVTEKLTAMCFKEMQRSVGLKNNETVVFNYADDRDYLDRLIDDMFERNKDFIKDRAQIFDFFCKSLLYRPPT